MDRMEIMYVTSLLFMAGVMVGGGYWLRKMVESQGVAVREHMDMVATTTARISKAVAESITEATTAALAATFKEATGEKGVANPQPTVGPDGDMLSPAWTLWETDEDDGEKWGVGDSVAIGDMPMRPGTAMINDGEPIIPGVPLPDMTGETYEP